MNYSQIASITGAVLAVVVGILGLLKGTMSGAEAMGLITAGLAVLGVHSGGSVAGSRK